MRLDVYVDSAEFAARPQAFDVSVVSPRSASHRVSSSASHAHIASKEREKRVHYRSLCDYYGIDLHPMVMDVYGCVGEGFDIGAQRVANFIAIKKGSSPSVEKHRLLTRLSSLVLQYVAVSVNRRKLNVERHRVESE